jgi:hypothetical protein
MSMSRTSPKPLPATLLPLALLLLLSAHPAGAAAPRHAFDMDLVDGMTDAVAPPPGSPLLLELSADGVQIYTCEAKNNAFEWTFTAPEAKLSDKQGHPAGTHSAGPTWKATDGSTVVGEVIAKADAPAANASPSPRPSSTPSPSAIPWLLLRAKSHTGTQGGPSGTLATVAYIRRIETKGGTAPATGCDASHVSQQTRVPYTATYQFYGAAK